jgi:hypothetical protein
MRRVDRRVRRTRNKKLAITWFLQSCIMRLGMRSLVLGSKDGLLVAAAGEGVDPEAAAAYAPFVFQDGWEYPDPVEAPYFVDAIPLDGTTLYLFAVGPTSDVSLTKTGTKGGLRRIIEEEAAA